MNAFCFVVFSNYFQSIIGNIGFTQLIIATVNITLDFCTIFENNFIILDFFSYSTVVFRITTIYICQNFTTTNIYSVAFAIPIYRISAINISVNSAILNIYSIIYTPFISIASINIVNCTTTANADFVVLGYTIFRITAINLSIDSTIINDNCITTAFFITFAAINLSVNCTATNAYSVFVSITIFGITAICIKSNCGIGNGNLIFVNTLTRIIVIIATVNFIITTCSKRNLTIMRYTICDIGCTNSINSAIEIRRRSRSSPCARNY